MNFNPKVKKLTQITEESQTPVHVPIVFDNECFIVTQQDLRRIEDIRLITYNKLGSNGELIPMESLGHDANIRDAILNACKYRMQIDQNAGTTDINILIDFIRRALSPPISMELGLTAPQTLPIASLEQQLQWAKIHNTSVPFPPTYSSATSTGEISSHNVDHTSNYCSNRTTLNISRGSNTMDIDDRQNESNGSDTLSAREQLKKKKMTQGLSCIS